MDRSESTSTRFQDHLPPFKLWATQVPLLCLCNSCLPFVQSVHKSQLQIVIGNYRPSILQKRERPFPTTQPWRRLQISIEHQLCTWHYGKHGTDTSELQPLQFRSPPTNFQINSDDLNVYLLVTQGMKMIFCIF